MVMALLAPEWVRFITISHDSPTLTSFKVVYTAYCEHAEARHIGKTMRKAFGQPEPPGFIKKRWKNLNYMFQSLSRAKTSISQEPRQATEDRDVEPESRFRRHPWTQAHSMYATMGGFVVDTRSLDQKYLPKGRQRMTLTPEGLKFIAEHTPDLVPDLPESAIIDKSKANAFTKLVTCGQALWYSVQCVTRSTQGLTISLLEINTTVHTVCALTMYFLFWWHKPLDVEEPTELTNLDTHPVIAFLVIHDMVPQARLSPMDMGDDDSPGLAPDSGRIIHHPNSDDILLRASKDPRFPTPEYVIYHGFAFPKTGSGSDSVKLGFTKVDPRCFILASEVARKHGPYTETLGRMTHDTKKTDYLAVRVRNRPNEDVESSELPSLIWLPLAGLFYGGVHLSVWNRSFRKETDELLWKISSLTIVSSGIAFAIAVCLTLSYERYPKSHPGLLKPLLQVVGGIFSVCYSLFYIFCRTFIIVECFLDVFHLPESAFEVPRWAQYFPHIG